ncbi:putative MBL fold metallo-hydrolase [Paratrimastix pyriformis]|uniref:MBL fold metallo-hydrolase n=1 Tax=Paratrimastix pyriformis TaxID=342808 RepID=A0ABQ8URJ2_9EUKA|nr:putative MBL fold metallo-hydrolase [Paratrimastix pyriformis]
MTEIAALVQESDFHSIWMVDSMTEGKEKVSVYIVATHDKSSAAFVDVGSALGVPRLMSALQELSIAPTAVRWIFLTHIHCDHFAGAWALLENLPNATIAVHPAGAYHVQDPSLISAAYVGLVGEDRFRKHYGSVRPVPAERIHAALNDEQFALGADGRLSMRAMHSPGHAPHHTHYALTVTGAPVGTELRHPVLTPTAGPLPPTGVAAVFPGDGFAACYQNMHKVGPRAAPVFFPQITTPFDVGAFRAGVDMVGRLEPAALLLPHYGMVPWQADHPAKVHKTLDRLLALVPLTDPAPDVQDLQMEMLCMVPAAARSETLMEDFEVVAHGLQAWHAQNKRK